MSETKKIVNIVGSGVSWSSFQTIITRFLGFFSALLILSRLSVFEYGLIELSLASLSIFSIFLLPGIQPVVTSDISELIQKKNGKQAVEHIKKYFNIQLLLSLFAFIIIFLISYLPIDAFQESSRVLIRVLSLSFLISPWRQTFQVVFSSILDFKARNFINILEEVSKFLFLLFMFNFFELGPVSVAFAIIASQFASVALMSKRYKSKMLFIKNLDSGEEFKYLSFNHYILGQSFWAMAGSYMNTFGQTCRLWIIKFLLGTEAVGLFSLAQSLYSHIVAVFSVTSVISPVLTRFKDDFSKFKRIVLKSIKYQLVASCIIGLVSFFVVPILIPIFFPEYVNSMSLFKIIILAIIPSAFASVFTSMYQSMNFQRNLFFAISFKNLSILVFSFVFIKLFGVFGIAYEYLLTTVIFTLSRYFNLKRIANISINLNDFISFDQDDKLVFNELIKKINSLFKFKKREKVS